MNKTTILTITLMFAAWTFTGSLALPSRYLTNDDTPIDVTIPSGGYTEGGPGANGGTISIGRRAVDFAFHHRKGSPIYVPPGGSLTVTGENGGTSYGGNHGNGGSISIKNNGNGGEEVNIDP